MMGWKWEEKNIMDGDLLVIEYCLNQGENHLVEKSHFPPKIFFPPTTFCTIILSP